MVNVFLASGRFRSLLGYRRCYSIPGPEGSGIVYRFLYLRGFAGFGIRRKGFVGPNRSREEHYVAIRGKSYKYTISVRWTGEKKGALTADGKPPVEVATPPEFKGHEGIWSPEDLYVASVNACIMTTFLSFAGRAGLGFEEYESEAEGLLEFLDDRFVFTKIVVRPRIVLRPGEERAKAEEILHKAERNCLVSNSIRTEVSLEPTIV
jgi:organic hydroperoxide reductase OsmC/OhrA